MSSAVEIATFLMLEKDKRFLTLPDHRLSFQLWIMGDPQACHGIKKVYN